MAAARWLLPWIKTQVRISSRSATGYTFPYLRSLEISFEYSGFWEPVANFWTSEWLTRMIAFTLVNALGCQYSGQSKLSKKNRTRNGQKTYAKRNRHTDLCGIG